MSAPLTTPDLLAVLESVLLADLDTVVCVGCGMFGKRKDDGNVPHLWVDRGHGLIECPRCSERD